VLIEQAFVHLHTISESCVLILVIVMVKVVDHAFHTCCSFDIEIPVESLRGDVCFVDSASTGASGDVDNVCRSFLERVRTADGSEKV
jgi:hypothetical protein